ncbi:hypothetical protein Gotur_004697, partial [Gossypium turneri]
MGFRQLEVEGDSQIIIVKINQGVVDRCNMVVYIEEIKAMATCFQRISFKHADKNANGVDSDSFKLKQDDLFPANAWLLCDPKMGFEASRFLSGFVFFTVSTLQLTQATQIFLLFMVLF